MKDEELNYDPDRFLEGPALPQTKVSLNLGLNHDLSIRQACQHIAQVFNATTGQWRCKYCNKLIEQYSDEQA